jgi:hypothetical protein
MREKTTAFQTISKTYRLLPSLPRKGLDVFRLNETCVIGELDNSVP